MPYLTPTETAKATTKPWFSRFLRHPTGKRSAWVCSVAQNNSTHFLTYLYFHRINTRQMQSEIELQIVSCILL